MCSCMRTTTHLSRGQYLSSQIAHFIEKSIDILELLSMSVQADESEYLSATHSSIIRS